MEFPLTDVPYTSKCLCFLCLFALKNGERDRERRIILIFVLVAGPPGAYRIVFLDGYGYQGAIYHVGLSGSFKKCT